MATRRTIALEFADRTVHQVYSHWDNNRYSIQLILDDEVISEVSL